MAIKVLYPNGDDNGWPTGDYLNIDESIASADGLTYATNVDNDTTVVDLDAAGLLDADTINSVTVKIRARDNGAGGNNNLEVDLLIGGVGQGAVLMGVNLTATFTTYTFTDAAWDIDWTSAQLDGMQLSIRSNQTGKGQGADWIIDAIDVDVDYTASAGAAYTIAGDVTITPSITSTMTFNDHNTLSGDVTITPAINSTMVFSAFLDSVESLSGGCFFCVASTKGNFTGSADALTDDLKIVDGDGFTLLTAKFDSLSLEGADGGTRGVIIGLLNATGGSLMSTFAGSDLFALQLNLDTVFSDIMYNSDFTARVDGNISGVPEPTTLALLGLGILIAGFARKNKYSI